LLCYTRLACLIMAWVTAALLAQFHHILYLTAQDTPAQACALSLDVSAGL
jgi:hypothetical protein